MGQGKKGAGRGETLGLTVTHRGVCEVMLFPDLMECVSLEVERDASIMKQSVKARERGSLFEENTQTLLGSRTCV